MEFRDPFDIENEKFQQAMDNALSPNTTTNEEDVNALLSNAAERDRYFFTEVDREQQFFNSLERQIESVKRDDVDLEVRDLIAENDTDLPTLPKAAGKTSRAIEKVLTNPLVLKLFTNPPDSKEVEDALVTMLSAVPKDSAIQYLDAADAISKSGHQRLKDEINARTLLVEHFRGQLRAAAL